jgi:Zn-dependent peptidase ImmA (M78 family)
MFPELTREDLAAGLDRVAEEILDEAGVDAPPVDALAVAKAIGVLVAMDDRQQGRARYVRLTNRGTAGTQATILLRPEPRFERRQWAIAHEIGEHVAHRVFVQWGADPRETAANAREQAANWLAGRLLLPTRWFVADGQKCQWDLLVLKGLYHTASHELIARRMLECRPAVVISIFDQQRLSFRASNVSSRVPPPSREEMECWRDVHCRCRPQRMRRGATHVQGWPIHEPEWFREILRMEVDDWAECM